MSSLGPANSVQLLDWLKELGVPTDDAHHVRIDIPARGAVTITIEVFADRKIATLPIPPELKEATLVMVETNA